MKPKIRSYGKYILAILVWVGVQDMAQAQTSSFVQQDVVKRPGIYTDYDLNGLSLGERQTTRTYFDGLGNDLQDVAIKASPQAHDIIQPHAYDMTGMQTTQYLPYVGADGSGSYRPNALTTEQAAFYSNGLADKVADDSKPYNTQIIEPSPLQRLIRAGMVGNGFQPEDAHYKSINYRFNSSSDGNIIVWDNTGTKTGYYAASQLSITEATDEDGLKSVNFKDFAGHNILKRMYTDTSGVYNDTYYIYNNGGLINFIVPPKAVNLMVHNANYSLTQTGVVSLVFSYKYDNQGRLIQKTVPGSGSIYMIYDPLNRLVLTTDSRMLASHKWYYLKYDDRDHAISNGIYTDPNSYSPSAMQTAVSTNTTYNTYWFERRNGIAATNYYTNNAFPSMGITPLAYAYYDNYDLDSNSSTDYAKSNQGLTNEAGQTIDSLRGVLTMTRKTTVGSGITGTWLTHVSFYDTRGRVIQEKSNNQITTAINDIKTIVYDFSGATLQSKVSKVTGSTTTTVLTTLGYDPMHRLSTIDQAYNGGSTIRVASYFYNELGQLVDKKLHSTNGGSTYLQSVDFRYNIRGQLLSINNSKLSQDTGTGSGYTNDDSNDLFGMQFVYDQPDSNVGTTGLFDGRLAAVKWMSKNSAGVSSNERSYKYTYDARNRLLAANYAERTAASTGAFNVNTGGFDESGIKYDENGNILTLNRNMSTVGPTAPAISAVDNLTYTYDTTNPNRLLKMTDGTGAGYTGYGFRNMTGAASTAAYGYDVMGNMTADPYKGLTMIYDDLGKTDKITITTATNRYITYTYDAGGTLLRKQAFDNNALQTTTDYIDGFVYITNGTGGTPTLSYFPSPEGRVVNNAGTLKNEYIISDQQGNARISFWDNGSGTAVVTQENSYYAFGLVMPNSPVALPTTPNKQLYNGGSEWQNDFSNLPDYYQTFFRNYDAALGRFIAVDPMPESAEGMTGYNYAGNNPVINNDPMGNYVISPLSQNFNQQVGNMWTDPGMLSSIQPSNSEASGFAGGSGGGTGGSGADQNDNAHFYAKPVENADEILTNPYELSYLAGATSIDLSRNGDYVVDGNGNVSARSQNYGVGVDGYGTNWQGSDNYTPLNANQGGQPWDRNGDGRLGLAEANIWYRDGNGKPITVPASSVNLTKFGPDLVKGMKIGTVFSIHLLRANFNDDGVVFGTIDVQYLGKNLVQILPNMYDFDIGADVGHPWKTEFFRNVATWLGEQNATGYGLAGQGKPFMVNFSGVTTLGTGPTSYYSH